MIWNLLEIRLSKWYPPIIDSWSTEHAPMGTSSMSYCICLFLRLTVDLNFISVWEPGYSFILIRLLYIWTVNVQQFEHGRCRKTIFRTYSHWIYNELLVCWSWAFPRLLITILCCLLVTGMLVILSNSLSHLLLIVFSTRLGTMYNQDISPYIACWSKMWFPEGKAGSN